jgi:hypothetical protein
MKDWRFAHPAPAAMLRRTISRYIAACKTFLSILCGEIMRSGETYKVVSLFFLFRTISSVSNLMGILSISCSTVLQTTGNRTGGS